MAISEQWAELLEPGLREIFQQITAALAAQSRIPALFDVSTSTRAFEEFLSVGSMGNWQAYKGAIEYDDLAKGYKTTVSHEEYVKGFKIERKLVEDDQYSLFRDRPADTLSALVNLGYRKAFAQEALERAYASGIRNIESLLRESLKYLTTEK